MQTCRRAARRMPSPACAIARMHGCQHSRCSGGPPMKSAAPSSAASGPVCQPAPSSASMEPWPPRRCCCFFPTVNQGGARRAGGRHGRRCKAGRAGAKRRQAAAAAAVGGTRHGRAARPAIPDMTPKLHASVQVQECHREAPSMSAGAGTHAAAFPCCQMCRVSAGRRHACHLLQPPPHGCMGALRPPTGAQNER